MWRDLLGDKGAPSARQVPAKRPDGGCARHLIRPGGRAMTTTTTATPTRATQPDLSGFLIAHAGMRQEFGLLSAAAQEPMDGERRQLWESQVALVLDVLHH